LVVPTPEPDAPPEAAVDELFAAEFPPLARTVEVLMKYESPPAEVLVEPAPTT
jgi:hypothetical protein